MRPEEAGRRPTAARRLEPVRDGSGSTAREIALDADTGLYPSGFDAVASALYNHWAEIAGRSRLPVQA